MALPADIVEQLQGLLSATDEEFTAALEAALVQKARELIFPLRIARLSVRNQFLNLLVQLERPSHTTRTKLQCLLDTRDCRQQQLAILVLMQLLDLRLLTQDEQNLLRELTLVVVHQPVGQRDVVTMLALCVEYGASVEAKKYFIGEDERKAALQFAIEYDDLVLACALIAMTDRSVNGTFPMDELVRCLRLLQRHDSGFAVDNNSVVAFLLLAYTHAIFGRNYKAYPILFVNELFAKIACLLRALGQSVDECGLACANKVLMLLEQAEFCRYLQQEKLRGYMVWQSKGQSYVGVVLSCLTTRLQEYGFVQVGMALGMGSYGGVYAALQEVAGSLRLVAEKHVRHRQHDDATKEEADVKAAKRERELTLQVGRWSQETVCLPQCFGVEQVGDGQVRFIIRSPALKGISLSRLIGAPQLSWSDCLGLIASMIDTVDFLHEHGVIHRDLKPNNLFFASNILSKGGYRVAALKLLDYGLGRPATGGRLTNIGSINQYCPPEIREKTMRHGKPVDAWAVGVMMAEILLGCDVFAVSVLANVTADSDVIKELRQWLHDQHQLAADSQRVVDMMSHLVSGQFARLDRYDTALVYGFLIEQGLGVDVALAIMNRNSHLTCVNTAADEDLTVCASVITGLCHVDPDRRLNLADAWRRLGSVFEKLAITQECIRSGEFTYSQPLCAAVSTRMPRQLARAQRRYEAEVLKPQLAIAGMSAG